MSYIDEEASILWQVYPDGRLRAFHLISQIEKLTLTPPLSANNNSVYRDCHAFKRTKTLGYIAISTMDNRVLIWDLNRGIMIKTISLSSPCTCCCFSNDCTSIFICMDSVLVHQYDIESGKEVKSLKSGKKNIQKLCSNPKADVLAIAASSSVKLLEIDTGRKKKIDISCPGGVAYFTFSSCGKYLILAGKQDREIVIINIVAAAASSSSTGNDASIQPTTVIPVNGIVTHISVKSKPKGVLNIVCGFENGGGCLFRYDEHTGDDAVRIRAIESLLHVAAANFSKTSSTVMIIEKSAVKYKYHVLEYENSEGVFIDETVKLNKTAAAEKDTNGSKSRVETSTEVAVLGPLESGGKKRPIVEAPQPSAKKGKLAVGGVGSSGETGLDAASQTLGERLEVLSRTMVELEDRSADKAGADRDELPTSDSLVTLVDQALQSGDDALLEQCLSCGELSTIEATAARLPAGRVLQLMKRLVAKFEKRPSRGILLTRWLSAVLRHHMAFLISLPDLALQLAGLSQMLEQRLHSYSRLAGLGGRLDLLLAQVSSRKPSSSSSTSVESQANKAVFIDE